MNSKLDDTASCHLILTGITSINSPLDSPLNSPLNSHQLVINETTGVTDFSQSVNSVR